MKRYNTEDKIQASDIAGYATELTSWRFIRDVVSQLLKLQKHGSQRASLSLDDITINGHAFVLHVTEGDSSPKEDVWLLGACVYELITGNQPFGGKGKDGQLSTSPLPSFNESKASASLSQLVKRCMAYNETERIDISEILSIAEHEVTKCEKHTSNVEHLRYKKPQNRRARLKTYSFWPETMMSILFFVLLAFPQQAAAQFDGEMDKLVRLTTMMRNQSNRAQVLKELKDDAKWTLMDELKLNVNECTFNDKVNMFGVNDIAAEIAQREKGILNVGGRFKHSADGVHQYSFIELTAKAGKTIYYKVKDHNGKQYVAVVPFDEKQPYSAIFVSDGVEVKAQTVKDGISYFVVPAGALGDYEFEITNSARQNASFVVITFNSGN